jgi:hypothetical protein
MYLDWYAYFVCIKDLSITWTANLDFQCPAATMLSVAEFIFPVRELLSGVKGG